LIPENPLNRSARRREWCKRPGGWTACLRALTCLAGFFLFVQASALPTHLGLLLLPAGAAPVTEGCEKETCCTPLCFVDEQGIHHCVHMPDETCACGQASDHSHANPVFLSAVLTLPQAESLLPDLLATGWVRLAHPDLAGRDPATPVPPPK
jgi:hypothetical protein